MDAKYSVIDQSGSFEAEDLIDLVRSDVLAIRIPGFASRASCETAAQSLLESGKVEYYPHAPEIGKAFNAFYEGHSSPDIRRRYYAEVEETARLFRQPTWPFLNPLEQLRLVLHDIWPYGATRENIHGKPMSFGLAQVFKEDSCALPYMDFLKMDEPDCPGAQTLLTQITAIVYIKPADEGGELELWRHHYNHEEFMARKNTGSYGLDYSKIPLPDVVINPAIGDLVLADSTRVHAVRTITKGIRIALNCFIGFRGTNQPLTYWS